LLKAHESALEEAEKELYEKHSKQKTELEDRLAKIRQQKLKKQREVHENQLNSERERVNELDQEEKREKALEVEKEAAIKIISETSSKDSDQIVDAILSKRHEKEVELLNQKWDKILAERIEKAVETADGDGGREQAAIRAKVETATNVDKASDLLKLKERHYQEKLDLLTECAPAAARNVEKDAQRMAKARKEIEMEKARHEEKVLAERTEWEREQREKAARELEEFEKSLANDLSQEEERMEKELAEKKALLDKAEDEKRQKMHNELNAQLKSRSEADQNKLIREHEDKLSKMDEKREREQKKMQEQIRKRLEAKKHKELQEKKEDLEQQYDDDEKRFAAKVSDEAALETEALVSNVASAAIENKTIEEEWPLSPAEVEKALRELPILGSLRELQTYFSKRFFDSDVQFGNIAPISADKFDRLEMINYQYALFLLKMFQEKCNFGKNVTLVISDKLPEQATGHVTNEFASDFASDGSNIVLKRRALSAPVGQLSVLLSYGFSFVVNSNDRRDRGDRDDKLQDNFYATQSVLMNDLYFVLNATERSVDPNFANKA